MIIKEQCSTGRCRRSPWLVSFCAAILDMSVTEGSVLHGSLGEHNSTERFRMYVTSLGQSQVIKNLPGMGETYV